jgi:gliding motility-associated-like protein
MKHLLFGLSILTSISLCAQIELSRDVMGSAGQSVSNGNLQMSYTIGEPFTLTLENSSIHTLGFQQPDSKPATELPFAIPGGISPNGDGVNEYWDIQGLEDYPNATVTVFNRWGQQVFYSTSKMFTWDGTSNGQECPTADYYYVIDLGNGEKFNGVVTLKR